MKTIQAHAGFNGKRGARAFTLVEIMISLLILSILLALLIGSVKLVTRTAKGTVDRQAVHSINMGASQFKQLFGFYVPLIRDKDPNPPANGVTIVFVPNSNPQRNKVNVHQANDQGPPGYLAYMQNYNVPVNAQNPLLDTRYSECSIPVYLAGELSLPLDPAQPSGVPIDGIQGAGFCKPNIDGTFAIPADLLHPGTGTSATKRVGATFEPLISLNGNAPRLVVDPFNPPGSPSFNPEHVSVVDRNGVPIRYYRWEHGSQQQPQPNPLPLNIPLMVGRVFNDPAYPALTGIPVPADRDISKNPNLRDAVFAIVAAGPDGFFGDEVNDTTVPNTDPRYNALDRMLGSVGVSPSASPAEIVKARMRVEQDNIVEVGK
jgi:prepilin-type N-terminal cleavage/methylation domain-containing protein